MLAVADRMPPRIRPDTLSGIYMDNSHAASRQHGLTLVQWGLLLVAFTLGVCGSFIVREIFPPAHAGVIQTAPLSPGAAR